MNSVYTHAYVYRLFFNQISRMNEHLRVYPDASHSKIPNRDAPATSPNSSKSRFSFSIKHLLCRQLIRQEQGRHLCRYPGKYFGIFVQNLTYRSLTFNVNLFWFAVNLGTAHIISHASRY